jgi:hypothetical protein
MFLPQTEAIQLTTSSVVGNVLAEQNVLVALTIIMITMIAFMV